MSVLIVGSLAYDSVSSPAGQVDQALGGSATYGGLACQFHLKRLGQTNAAVVGVVGADFSPTDRELLLASGLDLSGLEVAEGETFRWEGAYHGSMAEAETLATHLNVFEHFDAKVPEALSTPSVLFCANLHPGIQQSVMDQTQPRSLTMLDSMNLWISIAKDELLEAMKRADLIIINDGEARMLADDENLVRAMRTIVDQTSTRTLVVKRGEHGVLAVHDGAHVALPAYPTEAVVDPTGCGDTFAGTLAALMASDDAPITLASLRQGLVHATVTASFTLEAFGTTALQGLTSAAYEERLQAYLRMISP